LQYDYFQATLQTSPIYSREPTIATITPVKTNLGGPIKGSYIVTDATSLYVTVFGFRIDDPCKLAPDAFAATLDFAGDGKQVILGDIYSGVDYIYWRDTQVVCTGFAISGEDSDYVTLSDDTLLLTITAPTTYPLTCQNSFEITHLGPD